MQNMKKTPTKHEQMKSFTQSVGSRSSGVLGVPGLHVGDAQWLDTIYFRVHVCSLERGTCSAKIIALSFSLSFFSVMVALI